MVVLSGKSVFEGIAVGKLTFYKRNETQVERYLVADTEAELKRFQRAVEKAGEELWQLYENSAMEFGEANAMMFRIHKMMLEDSNYTTSITELIVNEKINAEAAVMEAGQKLMAMFQSMEDTYMKSRAADAKDVSERVLHILCARNHHTVIFDEPVIIAADDITPSEAVQLDKEKVLAIITMYGSVNSHTSILARTMNIPAVIGLGNELKKEYEGKPVIVDGFAGKIYVDPDKETQAVLAKKQQENRRKRQQLQELKGKENVTLKGRKVALYANISKVSDVDEALENDAGGIGLFRSEFLYLEKDALPDEEQQFLAYRAVAEKMGRKRVVIRTMDVGADKQADYLMLTKEENPAMGYRGIRICLKHPDIFKTQLRAIWRAAAYGNIAVMFPMITSVGEILKIKELITDIKKELLREGQKFHDSVDIGIMVETPAAALISDQLAKEVDFLSVGTNDLSQYIMAIDRKNEQLEEFYDAHHPAVLKLIQMTTENAHKAGIRIGICGELAADTTLTETFLEMGIDELSVASGMVLPLRKKIREI